MARLRYAIVDAQGKVVDITVEDEGALPSLPEGQQRIHDEKLTAEIGGLWNPVAKRFDAPAAKNDEE